MKVCGGISSTCPHLLALAVLCSHGWVGKYKQCGYPPVANLHKVEDVLAA